MAVALILSDHNRCVKSLTTYLESVGWCLSSTDTSFPAHGDTISGSCLIITVNHSLCASMVEPLHLKSLPPSAPHPLGLLIWEPFNQPEHSVLLAKGDDDVMCQDVQFTATLPKPSLIIPPGVLVKYFLHGWNSEEFKQAGAAVVSRDDLCPPFVATPPQKKYTCLGSNSTMKIILTSSASHHSNLLASLDSMTTWLIGCLNQQIGSVWMLPSQVGLWNG